ncbi:MAG: DUF1844 domain-containing protein [Deltaproteobacteria bacterium]|nr:DUF1844 domain-containing protein [Deltaproteobacteria bacterium]
MSDDGDEKGFVIKDRRLFDEGGEAREDKVEEQEKQEKIKEEEEKKAETDESKEYFLPEINFPGFILSLHTSAMFQFGDIADPVSKERKRNLPAVKQTIDILDMLKKKTSGNLDDDEEKLLDGILYELRMRYVKESAKS